MYRKKVHVRLSDTMPLRCNAQPKEYVQGSFRGAEVGIFGDNKLVQTLDNGSHKGTMCFLHQRLATRTVREIGPCAKRAIHSDCTQIATHLASVHHQ